jgi:hypothetical protein
MGSWVVGDENIIMNSGELPRKGTTKFRSLGLPLFDSFLPDDNLE